MLEILPVISAIENPETLAKLIEENLGSGELSLEQLKTVLIDRNWREKTWQKALGIILTKIEQNQGCELVNYLIKQNGEEEKFANIFLAADLLKTMKNNGQAKGKNLDILENKLHKICQKLTNYGQGFLLLYQSAQELQEAYEIRGQAISKIAANWKKDITTLPWLKSILDSNEPGEIRAIALH
jgi:DNA-binding Xre family transcriptional regulator